MAVGRYIMNGASSPEFIPVSLRCYGGLFDESD